MYEMIQMYLKKGDSVVEYDKVNFEKLARKVLTVKESKRAFLKNNRFPERYELSDDIYVRWVRSLGYRV